MLPAHYVAEHVELAYATTAHRAQGRTVDTAHAIVSPTTTREVLYVSATRGRDSNRLYVDTAYDPDPATSHDGVAEPQTARQVLAGVLANEGGEQSATDTIRSSWDAAESIGQLSAEYLTLASEAQHERWDTLIEHSGLPPARSQVPAEQKRTAPSCTPSPKPKPAASTPKPCSPPGLSPRPGRRRRRCGVLHGRSTARSSKPPVETAGRHRPDRRTRPTRQRRHRP